jgi:alkylation response protein AidB-like acyl-CoA dehydrogenase
MAFMPGERHCKVTMNGVSAGQIGESDKRATLETVLQEGAIIEAAIAVGSSATLQDMAVNYAKGRVQFGRPIGAFQGLQHMLAELATDVESSRLLVYYAAWQQDEGEEWRQTAAMARLCAANVFRQAAHVSHQIHGGYGFLVDTDVQLFLRRAKLSEVNATGAEVQREKIAAALGI